MEKTSKSGSVEKALTILDVFNQRNPFLSLQQLSKNTGYPKTTLFRMLCSLEKFGYIRRKQEKGEVVFGLGWCFLEKANLVSEQMDIKELAKNEMISIRNETDLSVQLAIREGKEAVYIEQIPSFRPIRIYPEIGRRVPLYSAACPRVLLAYLPKNEQEILTRELDFERLTPNSIHNKPELNNSLSFIKQNGFSVSNGELLEGTTAIAVPLFDSHNEVIASLSVIGMENDPALLNEINIIKLLKSSAENITNQLKVKKHV
jgi:IclR family KDG regulon transcriptional repressor